MLKTPFGFRDHYVMYLRQHGNMVYFGGRERSVVTIVDVPPLLVLLERITKAPRTPFFENQSYSLFYSTVGVYGVKTSIAPDDMVQEPAPVNYEGAYLRACSQFPAYSPPPEGSVFR
jgi:hypothetical protein